MAAYKSNLLAGAQGGTYLSNMSSGGVRPFAVLTLGMELAYVPAEARLRAFYQHTYGNGAGINGDRLI